MNKRILAICDLEPEYAYKLADFFERKEGLDFEVQAFSKPQELLVFCRANFVETILISESAYCKEIEEVSGAKIIILNESGNVSGNSCPYVDKYQSSDNIVREVMCYYAKTEHCSESKVITGKQTKLIGIYSPVKRCLQTSFALTLGQLMARKSKVLYLNFESYSGFESLLDKQYKGELSDLLYFVKHAKGKLLYRVESMIEKLGNLEMVPPIFSVVDLQMISGENWKELLIQLCDRCSYDYILLDLSDNMRGLFELLRMCADIYTITRQDIFSRAKLEQYQALLKETEYEDIWEKTKKWEFPSFRNLPESAEQLISSELAHYIRGLLGKDAYGGL